MVREIVMMPCQYCGGEYSAMYPFLGEIVLEHSQEECDYNLLLKVLQAASNVSRFYHNHEVSLDAYDSALNELQQVLGALPQHLKSEAHSMWTSSEGGN